LFHLSAVSNAYSNYISIISESMRVVDILVNEFERASHLPWQIVILRLVGAVLLGGVIGLEREITKDTGGLRTNMLIALASAALALITLELVAGYDIKDDRIRMDPLRLVEAVTAGVAFLAAGVVVFAKGSVRGLTTGAAMWVAAAIGLGAGFGHWLIAVVMTVLGVLILSILRIIEYRAGLRD